MIDYYQELLKWGDETEKSLMYNCIGTRYARTCKDGYVKLLGVEKDGKLCYNISIKNKELDQFLGYKNSEPDPIDKKIICNYLEKHGYIVENDYFKSHYEIQPISQVQLIGAEIF